MSPHRYLAAFRRYWLVVVAAAVLGSLAAWGLSLGATPQYTATTKLYFSPSFGTSASDLNQGSTYTQNQMLSFAQLAESPTVLEPVIASLGLDTTPAALANSITVTTPQNTVILDAAVTNGDPALAARIANEFAESVTTAVRRIAPVTTEKGSSVSVDIIASATVPTEPSSPDIRRNLLVGGMVGLLLGVLAILLRERLDARVRSAEGLATVTAAPLLGTIARQKRRKLLVTDDGLSSRNAESCRRMGAHLAALGDPGGRQSLLVTSSIPGEGKSQVALGLASAFAERGRRVLLVDADIRQPAIAETAGLDGAVGLTGVLSDGADGRAVVQSWGPVGLDILVAGSTVPRPSELMSSAAMADLIEELTARYDVLVIDTAPVNSVADAAILGSLVDGVVVVADSTRVLQPQLAEAMDSLEKSDVAVIGVVLNRMPRARGADAYPANRRTSPRPAWRSILTWLAAGGSQRSSTAEPDAVEGDEGTRDKPDA